MQTGTTNTETPTAQYRRPTASAQAVHVRHLKLLLADAAVELPRTHFLDLVDILDRHLRLVHGVDRAAA